MSHIIMSFNSNPARMGKKKSCKYICCAAAVLLFETWIRNLKGNNICYNMASYGLVDCKLHTDFWNNFRLFLWWVIEFAENRPLKLSILAFGKGELHHTRSPSRIRMFLKGKNTRRTVSSTLAYSLQKGEQLHFPRPRPLLTSSDFS